MAYHSARDAPITDVEFIGGRPPSRRWMRVLGLHNSADIIYMLLSILAAVGIAVRVYILFGAAFQAVPGSPFLWC